MALAWEQWAKRVRMWGNGTVCNALEKGGSGCVLWGGGGDVLSHGGK